MKKYVIISITLFLSFHGFSQQFSEEFGKVTLEDFQIKDYDKDPEAEAVVVFDRGESFFLIETNGGLNIRFTRERRIKIFKKSGVDYAEVAMPYYTDGFGKTEKVTEIEAYTYNLKEDGRIGRKVLEETSVFIEQINDQWKVKKFVFPDVKEGSIIEFKYVLETPFRYNLPDWQFQDRIPTMNSEYVVKMVPFYEYVFIAQGISRFSYHNSSRSGGIGRSIAGITFNDMIHTYGMTDVPAFRDESYITSVDDYIMKLDFQLAKFYSPRGGSTEIQSTWPKMAKDLLKHEDFGKYIKASSRISKKILEEELNLIGKPELEKVEGIVNYVKNSFEFNGRKTKYATKSARQFFEQKNGSSADVNLFLAGMLIAAGIDTEAVILSTRGNGKIVSSYPFSHFFNYTIPFVKLTNGSFLTDGTETLLPFNKIPLRCMNEKGLLVNEDNPGWIDLSSPGVSMNNRFIDINVDPESLSASTKVSEQTTNFEAFNYRRYYKNDSLKLKNHLKKNGFTKVSKISMRNFQDFSKPYRVTYAAELELEMIDDKLIISPFLDFPIEKNKLTQDKRSYPVDLIYSKSMKFTSIVNIPEGYKVLSMPKTFKLDDALAEIRLESKTQNGKIVLDAVYTFKKAVYKPVEYKKIKQYMDIIVTKFNEEIILEKL